MGKKTEDTLNGRTGKYLKYIDIVLIVIQLIAAVVLGIRLFSMGILPAAYMAGYCMVILVINILTWLAAGRRISAVVMAVISVLVTGGIIYSFTVVDKLDDTLRKISADTRLEVVQMSVVVLDDDAAEELADIGGGSVGYVSDDEGVEEIKAVIDETVVSPVYYNEYNNVLFLADGLLDGTEKAIIINSAYIDVISDQDGYEDFSGSIRELYTLEVETEVSAGGVVASPETDETFELSSGEDTFIVYISGVDTFGSVNVKSRSDVNILAIVNAKTGHIQLINTPRDYYVTLPEKGAKDKLTHAGLYGVECSESALEELYGIRIDYYIRMNFSGFEDIIDTLGGIDVYSEYDFTVEPIKHYTVGYNHLSGIEALAFARERHSFASGDIQRGINQMEVIKAMISKMTSSDMLTNYSAVLDGISDCFQTNIPSDVIYDFVRYQLSSGTSWTVDSYTVTGTGSHSTTYSMPGTTCYVMIPSESDVAEAKQLIEDVLAEE